VLGDVFGLNLARAEYHALKELLVKGVRVRVSLYIYI